MSALHQIGPALDTALADAVGGGARLPFAAAALTGRDGVFYRGRAGALPDAPLFALASMTKPLTATAALLLVDDGAVDLDEPLGARLPALAGARVLAGFDREPRTRAPLRPLTLRHLLSHTDGFANETWSADTARCIGPDGVAGDDYRYERALAAPLLFDPGARWQYGMGVDWAGRLIEQLTGMALGDALRQRLFAPLGMDDTAFTLDAARRARLARPHRRRPDGGLEALPLNPPDRPKHQRGGGGLYGSIDDYLRFVRLLLNDGVADDGRRLLGANALAGLYDNATGALRVGPLRSANPARSCDAEFFPGVAKTWTLGFMRNEEPAPTGRSAGSLAWAGIQNTFVWIDRAAGLGGVWATQLLPFFDPGALGAYLAFERAAYRNRG